MGAGGIQTLTADGVVGISGKPIRLYGATITSDGTPAVVAFYDGTSTGGTLIFQATGTASVAALVSNIPAEGILFPSGLFIDIDSHTTSFSAFYEVARSF